MKQLKIELLKDNAKLPNKSTKGSAGYDLSACLVEDVIIKPGERILIPTGIKIAIPSGMEGQIRPRSGLAIKHGITLLNTPGTIDSDYRGELKIIMINLGQEDFIINNGMRIAQIVFNSVESPEFIIVDRLDVTIRNENGFGHTGVK